VRVAAIDKGKMVFKKIKKRVKLLFCFFYGGAGRKHGVA